MHKGVSGRGVRGLELHRQGPQAALAGSSEGLAVLEQGAVEVEADVRLQAVRESFQHLRAGEESLSSHVHTVHS